MGTADWRTQSNGGLLLDEMGDIASTPEGSMDSIRSIVQARLQAALHGYQLYSIGADLERLVGSTISDELEVTLQRQTQQALMDGFLPRGSFQVQTLPIGDAIQIVVFLNNQVLAQAVVSNLTGTPAVAVTA